MKKWMIFAVVSCLCVSVAACAGAGGFSDKTIRYKMTVTVETPEGIKTGSTVREAVRHTEPSILPEQGGSTYNISKGEAVVIDLGQRGVLFGLLGGEDEAKQVFKSLLKNNSPTHSVELKQENYPKFVRFKDVADPTSVEIIIGLGRCTDLATGVPSGTVCVTQDNFKEIYGMGVLLKSITLETSSEEITRIAGKYMPSYRDQALYMKWFNTLRYGDPRRINANDFGSTGGIQ